MKIGILETGRPPEELDTFDSYPRMVESLLSTGAEAQAFSYQSFAVLDGEIPESARQCNGWVITGSRHGVYDKLPWIAPLKTFIRAIHAAHLPLLGICFGHQIIAEALGGKVTKSDKGWGLGLHTYQIATTAPCWLQREGQTPTFTLNAVHQDQIVTPPAGAKTIARSDFCEHAALLYGDSILSFQGHPEFSIAYETALIGFRRTTVFPEAVADAALTGLQQPGATTDSDLVARWARHFFQHLTPQQQVTTSE